MAASDAIRESLTVKVAGLPTWAWGLGVGGAVLGFMAWRDRGNDTEPEASPEPTPNVSGDPVTGGAEGPFTMTPSPFGNGSFAVAPVSSDPVEGDPTSSKSPETNEAWRRVAIDWAIGMGYPPITASEAIGKHLNGEPMTSAEIAVVTSAIRQFGAPPQGAPSIIQVKAKPVSTPKPPPSSKPKPKPAPTAPTARSYYTYEWRHRSPGGTQFAQRQDVPVESPPPASWTAAKAAGRTAKRFGPKTTTTLTLPGKVSSYEVAKSSYQ